MGRPNKREAKLKFILEKRRMNAYKTFAKLFNNSDNPNFSEIPTALLCLPNLGYGGIGGISNELGNKIIGKYEGFISLEMPLGKPFSFATFETVEHAIKAKEQIHYQSFSELDGRVLYAQFFPTNLKSDCSLFNEKVPDLVLIEEFVTNEQEKQMLKEIESYEGWSMVKSRHVKHFGFEYNYKLKHVGLELEQKFPNYIEPLMNKFNIDFPQYHHMNQLTISSYPAGSGIPPHCDSHTAFYETVLIISLKAPIVMEFREPLTDTMAFRVLPPRSLAILHGEARFGWEHAIRLRKSDPMPDGQLMERQHRISLTFRKIREIPECKCDFPHLCDIEHLKKIKQET